VFTKTQLAFVNTGSVRAGLTAGPVTYGELFTIAAVPGRLRGHVHPDRRAGLGVAAAAAPPGTGGIMQISGLHSPNTGGQITGAWLGAAGDNGTPIPNAPA